MRDQLERIASGWLLALIVASWAAITVLVLSMVTGCGGRLGPMPSPAELHLGEGAVCSPPSGGVAMCVFQGRLYACVESRREGRRWEIACAPTRPNVEPGRPPAER